MVRLEQLRRAQLQQLEARTVSLDQAMEFEIGSKTGHGIFELLVMGNRYDRYPSWGPMDLGRQAVRLGFVKVIVRDALQFTALADGLGFPEGPAFGVDVPCTPSTSTAGVIWRFPAARSRSRRRPAQGPTGWR